MNDYYLPVLEVTGTGTSLIIENETDGSAFTLDGIAADQKIMIDCKNQILTGDKDSNLYKHWNAGVTKVFLRFVRGPTG